MRPRSLALTLLAIFAASASVARADGDPGSDVLAYQRLFLATDAGVSVPQQAQLGDLLRRANQAGLPVRVAIIASRSDLGAITGLWRKPRAYARFLGIELSLAYKGRLLVVMPNGFGVNWPGHATAPAYRALSAVHITPTGAGLATAAATATAAHITIPGRTSGAGPTPARGARDGPPERRATERYRRPRRHLGRAGALAAGALGVTLRVRRRRRAHARPTTPREPEYPSAAPRGAHSGRRPLLPPSGSWLWQRWPSAWSVDHNPTQRPARDQPEPRPGNRLTGSAPKFTLSDEFGRPVSLRSFRGKVVILAFNDSECTTICPLSTSAMLDAKAMLGSAGRQVQLLGIDANPRATALADVLSYSQLHGMLGQWHFLTGSLAQLRRVWKAYSIGVDISRRLIDHTPAVFVIDTHGRLARLYITQQSYAAVGQFGQLLAQEASRLLPDHPPVDSHLSYTKIPGIPPSTPVTLPRSGGGSVSLGPGPTPRLLLFFATWNQQSSGLAGQLHALDRYQTAGASSKLPPLTAVDEASVEPSASTLPAFLRGLPHPLAYPVAIDRAGRLADGYGVEGEPWLVLTSPTGQILWYCQVSTSGWLSARELTQHVRDALARAPKLPTHSPGPRNNWRAHRRRSRRSTSKPRACSAASKPSPRGSARCAAIRS